jgi:iron complex transport system substrate-binding protein
LLYAIGAGSQLVGATEHCNYPEAATKLVRVGGGTLQGISRETILGLNPDLILCKWDSHQPLIDPFERFKVPILAIGPDRLNELYDEAILLGRVTGHSAEAAKLIEAMKQRVVSLTARIESLPNEKRRRVFYEVWDEPLMTAGPNSFIGEMLEMGGMTNIFDDTTVRYPRISDEVILARDPQVILAPSTHRSKVSLEIVSKRQGWDRISAVRDKQVFLIDGDCVSRCGPRMLDALEEMIQAVYPDTLKPIESAESLNSEVSDEANNR